MVREFMIIYFLRVNDNVGIFPQHSKLNHIRRRKTVSSIVRWYTRRRNIQWWVQSFSWTVKDNILETFTFNKQMHYPDTTNCQQDIVLQIKSFSTTARQMECKQWCDNCLSKFPPNINLLFSSGGLAKKNGTVLQVVLNVWADQS